MLARDLVLVGVDEVPVADDFSPRDVEPVDPVRRGEDEAGDGIGGAAELEAVRPPDREVGALSGRELADVVAAEHRRAAARPQPERLANRHRLAARRARARRAAPASPRGRGRSARSTPSRRRRARPARPRRRAPAPARPRRRGAGSRSGSAPTPTPARAERRHVLAGEVDAVGAPDVVCEPADASRGTRPAGSRRARRRTASSSTVSARCVCSFSPSRRASAADSAISSFVTENGEQGATASCTIPSASWSPASRSVSARMSSIDSTSESGGRPPCDSPRSIEPREATIRTPISPAACTSASQRPGPAAREDVVVVEHRRAA